MTQITKTIDVDALAQEIRRIDGNHSLGAGALAEALIPFLSTLPIAGEGKVKDLDEEQIAKLIWQHLPSNAAKAMTIDKHPPLFPQAEYTVATLSAKNFVEAIIDLTSPSSPGKDGGQLWDDPTLDGTDGAHPAWWRGCDHGYAKGLASVGKDGGQEVEAVPDRGEACPHCKGEGCQPGDPEGAPLEACDYCNGSGKKRDSQPASTALVERLEREREYAIRWANKAVADVKEHDRDRIAELETVLSRVEDVIFGSTLRVGSPEYFGVRKLIRDALSASTSREGESR